VQRPFGAAPEPALSPLEPVSAVPVAPRQRRNC
jgi:hypothetical protein